MAEATTREPMECRTTAAIVDPIPGSSLADVDALPLSMVYLLALIRSREDCRQWCVMRSFYQDRTRNYRVLEAPLHGDFSPAAGPADADDTHSIAVEARDGLWSVWRPDGTPIFRTDQTGITFVEPDYFDLSGASAGAACRWNTHHPTHAMAYTSHAFELHGRYGDHAVEGALFLDVLNMPVGKSFYPSPYLERMHVGWLDYLNVYDDGSIESGSVIVGTNGFTAMTIQHAGAPMARADHVTLALQTEDSRPSFPTHAVFRSDEATLVWEAHDASRWPVLHQMPDGHRIRLGTVRREGADRPVASSHAFFESFPHRAAAL